MMENRYLKAGILQELVDTNISKVNITHDGDTYYLDSYVEQLERNYYRLLVLLLENAEPNEDIEKLLHLAFGKSFQELKELIK